MQAWILEQHICLLPTNTRTFIACHSYIYIVIPNYVGNIVDEGWSNTPPYLRAASHDNPGSDPEEEAG